MLGFIIHSYSYCAVLYLNFSVVCYLKKTFQSLHYFYHFVIVFMDEGRGKVNEKWSIEIIRLSSHQA